MQEDPRGDLQRAEEANRLYWHTEMGVNQIAEEMGLSKGALYALVEPLDAGRGCPRCSGTLMYSNRTARDRGFLSCPSCGFEEEEEALDRAAGPSPTGGVPRRPRRRREETEEEEGPSPSGARDSTRTLVGAGLVVLAAGLLVARLFQRR